MESEACDVWPILDRQVVIDFAELVTALGLESQWAGRFQPRVRVLPLA
jgi:hypothetical protein